MGLAVLSQRQFYKNTNREQRQRHTREISTLSKGSHNATLHPTLNVTIGTFFASCGRTEKRTCIDVPSLLFRHRAKHRSIPIPPRWGGSLGALETCSISTIMRAESGEGMLFRQSDNAVFFFPMTCEPLSANPPLQMIHQTGKRETIQLTSGIEFPCQCHHRPFEGSLANPCEPLSRSA